MQMPPPLDELDDDDGDVQQNGAKSAEVERKLDAGNLFWLSSWVLLQWLVKKCFSKGI